MSGLVVKIPDRAASAKWTHRDAAGLGSKRSTDGFGQVTAFPGLPVIHDGRNAASGGNDRFWRKQTFARSGPMSELRTKPPLAATQRHQRI